jgi:regulator-associated protein of mTOR
MRRTGLTFFRIWDWQRQKRLNRFSNRNPAGSKINEVRYINEDDQALLMTGSSDGVLKVFRNYESSKEVEIITAFRALPELIPSNRNAGLVMDWQQGQGKALVAGDVKVIRVWNAATEVCTNVSLLTKLVDVSNFTRIFPHDQAHASPP